MTDDDHTMGDSAATRAEEQGTGEDRRAVRSEAEGAVPDEQQTEDGPEAGDRPKTSRPAQPPGGFSPAGTRPDASGASGAPGGATAVGGATGAGEEFGAGGAFGAVDAAASDVGSAPGVGRVTRAGGAGTAGSGDAPDRTGKAKGKKQGSFWKELPVLIGVALVLALVIKAFAVQAFYIPSQSMEDTLKVGDRVLVNKIVYRMRDIQRGDVVVFNGLDSWDPEVTYAQPSNPVAKVLHTIGGFFGLVPGEKDYIKRVIGVGGDHVHCSGNGAPILVNGHPLTESPYLYPGNVPSSQAFDITVPPGRLWVMGDHRDVSADSRYHLGDPGGGSISTSKVVGRAFVVVWPVDRWKTLPIPQTFQQPGLAAAAMASTPLALGFAGAVPITIFYRRLRRPSAARVQPAS